MSAPPTSPTSAAQFPPETRSWATRCLLRTAPPQHLQFSIFISCIDSLPLRSYAVVFDREKSRLGFASSGGLCSVNGSLDCGASCNVVGPDYSIAGIFTPLVIGLVSAAGAVLLVVAYFCARSCCCSGRCLPRSSSPLLFASSSCFVAGALSQRRFPRIGSGCLAVMLYRSLSPCH
jgi:hypothetical protein